MNRLAGHYVQLLQGAVAEPHLPLSRLPLLQEAERRELLHGFNATDRSYSGPFLLHRLLEQQAQRTPDARP